MPTTGAGLIEAAICARIRRSLGFAVGVVGSVVTSGMPMQTEMMVPSSTTVIAAGIGITTTAARAKVTTDAGTVAGTGNGEQTGYDDA